MNKNIQIIAAFQGMGKTKIAEKYSNICDLEILPYYYDLNDREREHLKGPSVQKRLNPNWPGNYVSALKQKCTQYDYVFVGPHPVRLLKFLDEAGIKYQCFMPEHDALPELKQRLVQRGNPKEFCDGIWEHWVNFMAAYQKNGNEITLLKKGQTIEDYFKLQGVVLETKSQKQQQRPPDQQY